MGSVMLKQNTTHDQKILTNEELQELSVAAVRGMRIELAAWLTDEIYECNALLHERQERKPGYLRSWRWRVGCRLLERLERAWPPELADERELPADSVPDKAVSEPRGGIGRTADRASEGASVLTTDEVETIDPCRGGGRGGASRNTRSAGVGASHPADPTCPIRPRSQRTYRDGRKTPEIASEWNGSGLIGRHAA
jgi:hypothetical protein